MKLCLILTSFICIFFYRIPCAQIWTHLDSAGYTNVDYPSSITTDSLDNVFVAAHFVNTAYVGNDTLNSAGAVDISLTKYDTTGQVIWSKSFGGSNTENVRDIKIYNQNIFITGTFLNTTVFDGQNVNGFGLWDIFIAKLDIDGNLIWIRNAGGTSDDNSSGITFDPSGNIYITGDFATTATFGPYSVTSSGIQDFFIAKYDQSGNPLWVKRGGGTGNDEGLSIDYSNNNLYVTGVYYSSATFGSNSISPFGNADFFLLKYDLNGNNIWAKGFGSTSSDVGFDLETDIAGDIYISGYFGNTVNFGGVSITSSGAWDVFLAKYDFSGALIWVKGAGGPDSDYFTSLHVDDNQNIFITGLFSSTAQFGSYQLTSSGNEDIFVVKYNSTGNVLWVKSAGGLEGDRSWGISSVNGTVYICGRTFIYATAFFDCLSISNPHFGTLQLFAILSIQNSLLLNLGNDTTLCQGQTLTLDASDSTAQNATYMWQDNSTDSTFLVTQQGIYWVQVTDNCNFGTDTIVVNYNQLPTIEFGNDTAICQGETLTLDATTPNSTYMWQDNSINPTFNVMQQGTYWVQVTDTCGSTTDTINISYNPIPTVNLGNDTTLCQGETFILDAITSNATYLWQDNSTNSSFNVTQQGVYWTEVTVNNCSKTDTLNVTYAPLPTVDLGTDMALCLGENLTLDATTPNVIYMWQDNSTNPTFDVTQQGTYWVQVTDTCGSTTDTINISYNPIQTVDLGNDTTLCQGQAFILDVATSNVTYLWQDNSTNTTFNITQQGTYWVEVTDSCETASDTITINYNILPVAYAGEDTTIVTGINVQLSGSGGTSYSWSPSLGLSCTICQYPEASPPESTLYYLTAVDSNGCIGLDSVTIYIDASRDIFVPNLFSPNGDGMNDVFHVDGKGIQEIELKVYNRWGKQVFSSTSVEDGWDGYFQGKEVNPGVFAYIVKGVFVNGQDFNQQGNLTLVR